MKTRHTISTAPAANVASPARARVHSFMAIVGIVTAIICTVILLQDVPTAHIAQITSPW